MREAFTGMIWLILAVFLGWLAFNAIRGMYRYYRDNRPNRYRRDVLPPPSKEALRKHTTQAVT